MAPVGLVLVSHSAEIAGGLRTLAAQMAPTTRIEAAGGTDEGGIGTSFDRVSAAIGAADAGDGVVVIGDLGSAILTAETAVDLLDDAELRERTRVLDVPLVEGAVAAAVAAETGADLAGVVAAARSSLGASPEPAPAGSGRRASASTVLAAVDGLHARPAAELARLAGRFEAAVRVNGVDAKSLLRILSLGLPGGASVTVEAEGVDSDEAVRAVVALLGADEPQP